MNKTNDPNFFHQELTVSHVRTSRTQFIQKICTEYIGLDKNILHVGCADWPIFNINNNLHRILTSQYKSIDGYDVNSDDIDRMKTLPEFKGCNLYSELPSRQYDVLIIPEVIEHVNCVGIFIRDMITLVKRNGIMVFTAPNAFNHKHSTYHVSQNNKKSEFTELIHPDHNYWFSLYTLPNCIKKCAVDISNTTISHSKIGLLGPQGNEGSVYCITNVLDS
jgi:2-polyprenyl-3-methyl-5-hydroxy-6-metoxy-1,4-benzoquinol methylase